MDDSCAVCAESLDWVAYGSCGHREVCSTCVVRLRFVLQDPKCCICKTHLDTVFVTKALGHYTRVITDFSAFPPNPSKGQVASFWFHEGSQAYIDDVDHYQMINAMCTISCNICEKNTKGQGTVCIKNRGKTKPFEIINSIDDLKCHLKCQHNMFMCELCLKGKKVFICEQKLYTQSQLDKHMKTGDLEVDGSENECGGFKGHPICEFCRDFFYGDSELYAHMSTEHYTCHICRRQHPEKHDYFNNYDNLEVHFRHEHFLCEDEACLGKKFVVFQSEAEMKRHNVMEHGGNMSRSKRNAALQIPISFTYRRSNYQGQQRGRGRVFDSQTVGSEDDAVTNFVEFSTINSVSRMPQISSGSTHVPELSCAPNPPNDTQPSVNLTAELFPPLPRVKRTKKSKNKVANTETNTVTPRLNRKKNSATISTTVEPSSSKNNAMALSNNNVAGSSSSSSFPQLKPLHDHDIGSSNSASLPRLKPVHNHLVGPSSSASFPQIKPLHNHITAPFSSTSLNYPTSMPAHEVRPASLTSFPPLTRPKQNHEVLPYNSSSSLQLVRPLKKSSSMASDSNSNISQKKCMSDTEVAAKGAQASEEIKTSNKTLIEKIQNALGDDKEKFAAFKCISSEYRDGEISTMEYIFNVEQFGLTHLLSELARLCPDPDKKKELADAYIASIQATESSRKNKGKGKASVLDDNFLNNVKKLQLNQKHYKEVEVEVLSKDEYRSNKSSLNLSSNSNGGVKSKTNKKTSKFNRVRLGENSEAAVLNLRHANANPETRVMESSKKPELRGLPVKGVWRNNDAKKLFAK